MALKNWHYGKLIILWVWGAVFMALVWYALVTIEPESGGDLTLGFATVIVLLAIPAGLSLVTWRWLGGKEGEGGGDKGSQ